jgi:Family of unknown function (DUF5678)
MDEEISYVELQEQYPNEYVAVRGREVVAHAPTFDELWTALAQASVDKRTVQIEWVESPDSVSVY